MQTKTFIHQLHGILQQTELCRWIWWSEEEDGVFILRPYDGEFSSKVLKRFFKHGNVSSFVRQLHMYGFHKLNAQSQVRPSKDAVVWEFSHPSGRFRSDSSMSELSGIQRKSSGVGKDGKRKNVLSPICVNYVETGPRLVAPGNGPVPHQQQVINAPTSSQTGADLPGGDSNRDSLQPLPKTISPLPSLRTTLATPAVPENGFPSSSPDALPQQLSMEPGCSNPATVPLLPTPVTGAPHPALTPQSFSNLELHHFNANLSILQRCMVGMLDLLQQIPNASASEANGMFSTLQSLKNEIINVDTRWTHLRYPILSTHSSFSSINSSVLHHPSGNDSRFPSLSSQKNSIFSNPRFSNVSNVRGSSSSVSGTTTQFSGAWNTMDPNRKK